MYTKLIDKIKKAIISKDQNTIFSNDTDFICDACIDYLKYKGYRIIKPTKSKIDIKSSDDLISYFYVLLDRYHPEYVNVYKNIGKDRAIAKSFVSSRIEDGNLSKKAALVESLEIIETVFKYEKEFKFKYDIDFGLFGQSNLGWVTVKAIKLMNSDIRKESEDRTERKREEMISDYDSNDIGYNDLDELLEKSKG